MRTAKLATRSAIIPQIVIALAVVFALSYHSPSVTQAVDVFTDPVGFYQVTLLTNSDTFVSIPFTRIPEFRGRVSSVSGNTINVAGNPGWAANQWATPNSNGYYPYYVKIETGAKEGAYYTITNNTASALNVIPVPEDLSGVLAGDRVHIIPFWTLNTVFPGGTGVVASVSALLSGRRTTILFPDMTSTGINLAASAIYYYFNGAWRRAGFPATSNFNDVVILPDQYIVGRQQNNAATTTPTTLGQVVMSKVRIPLYANSVASGLLQDNAVALYRPSVQTLDESGLANAFVPSVSSLLAGRRDSLLVFDNTVQGINKSAAAIYYYFNGAWRRAGVSPTINFGPTNVFHPGIGVVVRKTTNNVPTTMWVNSPNY